jgi:hypothetical protein
MEPSPWTVYLASRLDQPHYQISQEDKHSYLLSLMTFLDVEGRRHSLVHIASDCNYHDSNLICINVFDECYESILQQLCKEQLFEEVISSGGLDMT